MVGLWNATAPDGAQSVRANRLILGDNTEYVRANLNLDHYWGTGNNADEDGHHRFIQTPKFETGGTPDDPTWASGMDAVFYAKKKVSTDATAQQDVQPFFMDKATIGAASDVTQYLQLLGMRACGVFSATGGTVVTQYLHNIRPSTDATLPIGIERTAAGIFKVTFLNQLPTANYLVLGGAMGGGILDNPYNFNVLPLAVNKTDTSFGFQVREGLSTSNPNKDPLQCWFVVFGG